MAKRSKQPAWLKQFKKNQNAYIVLALLVLTCVYFLFFAKVRTTSMAKTEEMVLSNVALFQKSVKSMRKKMAKVSDDRKTSAKNWFSSLSAWQRTALMQESLEYSFQNEFPTLMKNIQVPKLGQLIGSAVPEIRDPAQLVEDAEKFWKVLRDFENQEDQNMNDQDRENYAPHHFWTGMEEFSESEANEFNSMSWAACRSLFLGKFLERTIKVMEGKLAQIQNGETLEWPEEPAKEPTWEEEEHGMDVVHAYNPTDFEAAIQSKTHAIVMFYAPWCGHCKKFKPDYGTAASALLEVDADAVLIGVDATEAKDIAEVYEVKSYPTMKYFFQGSLSETEFDGQRNTFGVLTWLNDESRLNGALTDLAESYRPPKELTWAEEDTANVIYHATDDTFQDAIASKSNALVMFYAPWCGHCKKFKPGFTSAAARLQAMNADITMIGLDATENRQTTEEFEVKGYPTTKFYSAGEWSDFKAERSEEGIMSFLAERGVISSEDEKEL